MIVTVTLNASIDKAYKVAGTFQPGGVTRVAGCRNSAGGKGLNVARVAKLCGAEVLATGFAGGYNGAYLQKLLGEDEIIHDFVPVKGETRSCINILDDTYKSTEFLEPGFQVETEEKAEFIRKFHNLMKKCQVVTLSGSIPTGLSQDIYAELITIAREHDVMTILDTSGAALHYGLAACPHVIKPNREELEQLYGRPVKELADVRLCAEELLAEGISRVMISLGKDGALLMSRAGIWHGKPPAIAAVNTVGCGDSMVAAYAAAVLKRRTEEECLRYAVAVSAANALQEDTGRFAPEDCREIYDRVAVEIL